MDPQTPEWIKLANQVGFPIWVAVFLLVRLDRTLKEMTHTVNDLIRELKTRREE